MEQRWTVLITRWLQRPEPQSTARFRLGHWWGGGEGVSGSEATEALCVPSKTGKSVCSRLLWVPHTGFMFQAVPSECSFLLESRWGNFLLNNFYSRRKITYKRLAVMSDILSRPLAPLTFMLLSRPTSTKTTSLLSASSTVLFFLNLI